MAGQAGFTDFKPQRTHREFRVFFTTDPLTLLIINVIYANRLGTQLALNGMAPQIAQKIMRHKGYRKTLEHYTVLEIKDTAKAINSMSIMAQIPETACSPFAACAPQNGAISRTNKQPIVKIETIDESDLKRPHLIENTTLNTETHHDAQGV